LWVAALCAGVVVSFLALPKAPFWPGLSGEGFLRRAVLDVALIVLVVAVFARFGLTPARRRAEAAEERCRELAGAVASEAGSRAAAEQELQLYQDRVEELVTERTMKFARLNRLYLVLTGINEAIVRIRNRETLLAEVCRIAVEHEGLKMAWVALVDPGSRELVPAASSGGGEASLFRYRYAFRNGSGPSCPLAEALLKGRPFVSNNIHNGVCGEPASAEAKAGGFSSEAVFPLTTGGHLKGVVGFCSDSPVFFNDDEVHLLQALANDVSYALEAFEGMLRRKHAEESLWVAERKYREIVENTVEGIFQSTRDGQYLMANSALARILGYDSPADVITSITSIATDVYADSGQWERFLSTMEEEGRIEGFELLARKKNGEHVWLSMNARSVRDEDGYLLYYEGTVEDITERMRAEALLRQSEERFRVVVENAPDAIIIQTGGRFAYVNRTAVELFGAGASSDLIGKPVLDRVDPGFRELVLQRIQTITTKESAVPLLEERYLRLDGSAFDVEVAAVPVMFSARKSAIVFFRDITERKRLEAEARHSQSKLIQSNKMASLGMLVSSVAHEVNNPNNFIMFNSALVRDTWTDALRILDEYRRENGEFSLAGLSFGEMREAIPRLLQAISDGSVRIRNIVERLRNFARTDPSGLEGVVDLNAVISDAVFILNHQINRHTERFSLDLAPGLPRVKGSSQQLEQVVINLVMNALQSLKTRKSGVALATYIVQGGLRVGLTVSDEGCGMPKEVVSRILEPFFTTKHEAGGTGLGLSISSSIIRDHQGTLLFDSEPGRGTTATVSLPAGAAVRVP
jgi:hypothetical protein